jgi:hypothetical protein
MHRPQRERNYSAIRGLGVVLVHLFVVVGNWAVSLFWASLKYFWIDFAIIVYFPHSTDKEFSSGKE